MKIVINCDFGGFSISWEAAEWMAARGAERARKEIEEEGFLGYGYVRGMPGSYSRTDPLLIAAVETLGEKASGAHAHLKIVTIPDDVQWQIEEYDGKEWIAERHRTWKKCD